MYDIQNPIFIQKHHYHHATKASLDCFIGTEQANLQMHTKPLQPKVQPLAGPMAITPEPEPSSDPLSRHLAHSLAWWA